jgi:hypothetical protein
MDGARELAITGVPGLNDNAIGFEVDRSSSSTSNFCFNGVCPLMPYAREGAPKLKQDSLFPVLFDARSSPEGSTSASHL